MRAVDDRPYKSSAPKACHCEAHRAVAISRYNLQLLEYQCRGDILPGDSHGRHSRPRNDIFFQGCVDSKRLLLEEKLAFARNEQMTDVV